MAVVPDLVLVSKLETLFSSDPEYTQHVQYTSGTTLRQRKIRKEERWRTDKKLGRGSYGTVRLERCIHGDKRGELRAVKSIQKVEAVDYYRELEAIVLFSHGIVCC
jgi:hypothetical protein